MRSGNREYPDRPYVGVGVVVFREQEVLLIKKIRTLLSSVI